MNISITKISFKQVLLAMLMCVAFFAQSAVTTHAMTTEEHFASMQRQLDIASLQVQSIVAMRKVSMVLGASTSSSELQAMIDVLMAQIAALQNANPPLPPVTQKLFFKTTQIEKEIEVGQQDTPIATVQISKIKGENYLNQILVRVSPAKRNANALPWESFSEMSVWVGGYKVKGVNVNDPSLWKTITTEKGTKVYEFALFNGNQKLPNTLNKNVTATVAVTSTSKAVAKDLWTMWVPLNGVTIWNPTQKHTKYGPTERFKYTMVGGLQEEGPFISLKSTNANFENPGIDPSGDYDIDFDVTAIDTDVYIPVSSVRSGVTQTNVKSGIIYRIVGANGKVYKKGTATAGVDSMADEDEGYYVISEGESENLGAYVWFKPATSGSYRVELLSFFWTDRASGQLKEVKFNPATDFQTKYITITK